MRLKEISRVIGEFPGLLRRFPGVRGRFQGSLWYVGGQEGFQRLENLQLEKSHP